MSLLSRPTDPALFEIARDLEQSDLASLFVTSPTRLLRGLRDSSAQLQPSTPGQSAALKELLRVHREELAYALFVEAHGRLLRENEGTWIVYSGEGPEGKGSQIAPLPLAGKRVNLLLTDSSFPSDDTPPLEGVKDTRSLFAASLRTAPRESTRINWALALGCAGHLGMAYRVLYQLESTTASPLLAARSAHNLGYLAWREGDLPKAREHFSRAAQGDQRSCRSAAFSFTLALLLGDIEEAQRKARFLAPLLEMNPADLRIVSRVLQVLPIADTNRDWRMLNVERSLSDLSEPIATMVQALKRNEHL